MNTPPFIAGNWKMHPASKQEAVQLARTTIEEIGVGAVDVVLCVPAVFIDAVRDVCNEHGNTVSVGAQDCFWKPGVGAVTGGVSATMLADRGVSHVIIGHSERRRLFGEGDDIIQRKVQAARAADLDIILAVGEETQEDDLATVVRSQLRAALDGCTADDIEHIIVAYEPVWAISTTQDRVPATPDDALTGAITCRKVLADLTNEKQARRQRVIYGGSVDADNILSYLGQDGIDGALPGGASLDSATFAAIVQQVADYMMTRS